MHRFDSPLQAMLAEATERGFFTFQQVDEYLPDEGGDASLIDCLVMMLEETGLPLRDDPTVVAEMQRKQLARQEAESQLLVPENPVTSRDPIRMYLSQMGSIPLLSREREIFLAKRIEITRKRLRRTVLESDFAMQHAVETLEKIQSGDLPFERTLRTSETESVQKEQIIGRMSANLRTLKLLMQDNERDFRELSTRSTNRSRSTELREQMVWRRRKMVSLCEELSLRTSRLQPLMKRMQQLVERLRSLKLQIDELPGRRHAAERGLAERELEELQLMTLEPADDFIARVFETHQNSPHFLGFVYALVPPDSVERVEHNLLEELGLEEEDGESHPKLMEALVRGAGLLDRVDELRARARERLDEIVTEPLLYGSLREVGLSALVEIVGFEYMLSRVSSRIARFLQGYRGIEEADLVWFTHHSEVDIEHAEEGLDTIENYVSYYGFDDDEARDIIDAALRENVFIKRYFGVEAAANSRSMV